jgi:hypothetical protein
MYAPKGRLVFFFNHADEPASVEFARTLERPASRVWEIMTSQVVNPTGTELTLKASIPAQSVRIYRIEF